MLKKCSKCGELLDINKFTKDKTKKDGLYSSCGLCMKKYRLLTGRTKLPEILAKGYKRCTKCKKVKETKEYQKDKKKKDGFYSSCNECRRKLYGMKKRRNRGERFIDSNGYVREAGKDIRQHRSIIESILKRKLNKDESVHHINGIKTDNRIENLQVMSTSEHHKLHYKDIRKKFLKKRYYNKICTICNNKFISNSHRSMWCSPHCRYLAHKKYVKNWVKAHNQLEPYLEKEQLNKIIKERV